jgi:hypothetical protein
VCLDLFIHSTISESHDEHGGQPQLTCHDANQASQFSGAEITFADTTIGLLVSVALTSTPDLGNTRSSHCYFQG